VAVVKTSRNSDCKGANGKTLGWSARTDLSSVPHEL
jgi:hypothetical protein